MNARLCMISVMAVVFFFSLNVSIMPQVSSNRFIQSGGHSSGPILKATSASTGSVIGATIQQFSSSLTVSTSANVYIFGMATGGAVNSSQFSYGEYKSILDVDSYIGAGLAITTNNTNGYTTGASYYSIGGVGVSGYNYYGVMYGSNNTAGADSASVSFTLNGPSLVIVVALTSSQQYMTLAGPSNFIVDAASGNGSSITPIIIGHANLQIGTYTVSEATQATSAGQDPNHMVDLIGVIAFANSTSGFISTPIPITTTNTTLPSTLVPITINNTQSIATPSPFQQMLVINSSLYKAFEASNLSNIEFAYPNGSVIPSWLESGNTNSANHTIYWIKLISGIQAKSTITIYMEFMSITTNLFNTRITGEAPQLSPVYGEYDDGAHVFTHYENFNNSHDSVPAGWYDSGSLGGCSYVNNNVNNGYDIDGVNGCGSVYAGSNIPVNSSTVIDIQIYTLQTYGTDWQAPFVNSQSPTSYVPQGYALTWKDTSAACNTENSSANLALTTGPGGYTNVSILTGVFPAVIFSLTDSTIYANYLPVITGQTGILAGNGYLALAVYTSSACGSAFQGYWLRTRAQAPNNVMPAVTILHSISNTTTTTTTTTISTSTLISSSLATTFTGSSQLSTSNQPPLTVSPGFDGILAIVSMITLIMVLKRRKRL